MPESHEAVDAAGAAQKILNSISTGYAIAAQKLSNTRRLGSRVLPDLGEDPAPTPRRADKAMHHARQTACQASRLHADGY
jgi:predicted signal transduction protein with EAL and GGDEF domain